MTNYAEQLLFSENYLGQIRLTIGVSGDVHKAQNPHRHERDNEGINFPLKESNDVIHS
jgi:hydroxypyruvate isomerase